MDSVWDWVPYGDIDVERQWWKLINTLNIVLSELQVHTSIKNFFGHVRCIYVYPMDVEYLNIEELKAQWELAPVKVLEDFFQKCWTKEYLWNPLVQSCGWPGNYHVSMKSVQWCVWIYVCTNLQVLALLEALSGQNYLGPICLTVSLTT